MQIEIFSDGACSGNPGPGGYGTILRYRDHIKELSGFDPETTNNRMELTAVVMGLRALTRSCKIELFTDSVYVGKGITEWMGKWKANGWKRQEGGKFKPVKNVELWQQLDELLDRHEVKYTRVAGHSGHPENERCDELAVEASRAVG